MKLLLEPRHDLTPTEIDALENRLYEHNRAATCRDDVAGMGFAIHGEEGRFAGATAGYTWCGIAEIKQMWVAEAFRGRGYGRALLEAMIAEADRRGVTRIWVASFEFQAPAMYERSGFVRVAELQDWPEGYVNVILCKSLRRT